MRAAERDWVPERPCQIPGHPQDDEPQLITESAWSRVSAWHRHAPAERLPLPAALVTWPAAWIMHAAHLPGTDAAYASALAAAGAFGLWKRYGKKSPHPRLAALEAAAVTGTAGAWVTAATEWGPLAGPDHLLSLAYVIGALGGYRWLRRHAAVKAARKRRDDLAADLAMKREWHEILPRAGLDGWHVQKRWDTNLGEEILITTSPENALASRIAGAASGIAEKLEHILGLPYHRIDITTTGMPGQLVISIRTVDMATRDAAYHPMTAPWPDAEPSPFADWFPGTASIRDPAIWGFCPEDGSALSVELIARTGGRVVGVFGMTDSGKSNLLNCLREFVTRCPDARMIQLNGAHMGDELTWEPLSALTLCGPVATDEQVRSKIGAALRALCLLVTRRSETLAETGHSTFQPTPGHPAAVVFVDEVDEIVKHVEDAGQMLEFLASKQRKSAVALVLATQRAVQRAIGGGAVRANMSEALVGVVARASESRHASGGEREIPDIRDYSRGAQGYFQLWNPRSGEVTGRGRSFLLGKPPSELAYIQRLAAARRGLRDWSIPDLPPLDLGGGSADRAPQEVSDLRARLARASQEASQPRPAPAAAPAVRVPLAIPPAAGSALLSLLAGPDGISASAAGDALGVSKSLAHEYLAEMEKQGIAVKTGAGRASRYRLAAAPAPAPQPEPAAPGRPDGYTTIRDLADAVRDGLVDADEEARALFARVRAREDEPGSDGP